MKMPNLEPDRRPGTSGIRRTEFSSGLESRAQNETKVGGFSVTKVWQILQNPFALAAQGFLAGGLLFWTTRADAATILPTIF